MIIYLASYPKSGNTWLWSLLSSYYFSNDGNFKIDLLKNIQQFPQKKYLDKYKYELNVPGSTAQYWIKSQKEILLSYLNLFQDINCESFKDESVREKLANEKKLYTFIIGHQNGMDSLSIYQMRDKKKPKTEAEKYTVERMYATLNSGDIMLIQNYVFNKLLITIDELKGE